MALPALHDLFRPWFGHRQPVLRRQPRARLGLERLEDRLAPAVQLTYGGPGTALGLQELVGGATPAVRDSEPTPRPLRIALRTGHTFDASSTAQAPGLTYENARSPGTSHVATLDIGRANNVPTLQATLAGDALTLGAIANGSGGLGNVAASAAAITVTGLDTSHAGTGGDVDLKSAGALTVAPNALLDTGAGTLVLAAGVNADGTGNSNSGELVIGRGATVVSANASSGAITLRGAAIAIDTSANPALVGGRRDAQPTTPSVTLTGLAGPRALAFDASG